MLVYAKMDSSLEKFIDIMAVPDKVCLPNVATVIIN